MTADPRRQPLLNDSTIALCAPTQVWSGPDGEIGGSAIDGIYHGDVRHVRRVRLGVAETGIEPIGSAAASAGRLRFSAVLRGLDDDLPDPLVRLDRDRRVSPGRVDETLLIRSHRTVPVDVAVSIAFTPDFSDLQAVKAGMPATAEWGRHGATVSSGGRAFTISATDADLVEADGELVLHRRLTVPPRGEALIDWSIAMTDPSLVVTSPGALPALRPPSSADPRMSRWLARAAEDLAALRLALPDAPGDAFYAAGAPWFFTLFGRDSIWAARLALGADVGIAASTLRVLARMQGARTDPATAEAPGKILHELRSSPLALPSENVLLPPLYYGTVDATPLWVCLLADAWEAGMPEDEVRALLPSLRAALEWIRAHGDASGSGFIDYVDESGHGLANQGWKDSGDSVQWRDGTLARGPIALCEVQAYAYEAAVRGAGLLDAFGDPGGSGADNMRGWAADLRDRFRDRFWVTTPEGRYPAIALDADGRAVDTLASNVGHLIGTGMLDADEERTCADLLLSPSLSSGFGIRTLSTGAAGYWPLSYHGGSVWTHDTAIAVHGMLRAGLRDHAARVVRQLLDAAEAFDFRMPELHSGDAAADVSRPAAYPASCRPQAWSAAAAFVCAQALA